MPKDGGSDPSARAVANRLGGRDRVPVLLLVGTNAVPVLEVDPNVLDGVAPELRFHTFTRDARHGGLDAERLREGRGLRRVRLQETEGLRADLGHGPGGEPIGRHVQRVQRLAPDVVARVPRPRLFGDLAGAFGEVPGTGRRERAAHAGGGDETAVRRTVPSIWPDGLSVTTNTSPSFVRPAGVRSTAT